MKLPVTEPFTATRNACRLCTPLGACLALAGVEGCVPLLHGSQGCSTYIRRYLISHFREPMDIASSNFGEHAAIFGGRDNLTQALVNVMRGYTPSMIGIATTCLSETIGDDVRLLLSEFRKQHTGDLPQLVTVSTPSYRGSHFDGYIAAVRALAVAMAHQGERCSDTVTICPGIVSPADLRHLREIAAGFGLRPILLPDYADRLDGPTWPEYQRIPKGGTTLDELRLMGRAAATVEFTSVCEPGETAGGHLEEALGVPREAIPMPIGIDATDRLFSVLERISGRKAHEPLLAERGRLVDAYIDAHKYVFGQRAIVYGEEDLVVALTSFLLEIGVTPVLCASGGTSGRLERHLRSLRGLTDECRIMQGVDFEEITEQAEQARPDLMIGHSKGYKLARRLDVPLVRVGFPIHDRFGGQRLLHLGYRGTQQLFDRIVNALLERKQDLSEVGYTYL